MFHNKYKRMRNKKDILDDMERCIQKMKEIVDIEKDIINKAKGKPLVEDDTNKLLSLSREFVNYREDYNHYYDELFDKVVLN